MKRHINTEDINNLYKDIFLDIMIVGQCNVTEKLVTLLETKTYPKYINTSNTNNMSSETQRVNDASLSSILSQDLKSIRNQRLTKIYEANKQYKDLPFETQYALSLINILDNGTQSGDRTGTGTKRIQSDKITIDLTKEFPAITGKKVFPRGALVEMIWIMSGRTDIEFLRDNGVNYWDSWVKPDGSLGPIYGKQMRNFAGIDQLKSVVEQILTNPDSRRLMVSLWNPAELKDQSLECCHHDYQICSFIDHDGVRKLDLHLKQRSADAFLGIPYDFMLFAYYLEIISFVTDIPANKIHLTMADYHIYNGHEEAVRKYLDNYFNDPGDKFQHNIEYYTSQDRFTRPQLKWNADVAKEISEGKSTFDDIDNTLALIEHYGFDGALNVIQYTPDYHYEFIGAKVAV